MFFLCFFQKFRFINDAELELGFSPELEFWNFLFINIPELETFLSPELRLKKWEKKPSPIGLIKTKFGATSARTRSHTSIANP